MKIGNFPKVIVVSPEDETMLFAHDELLKYDQDIFGDGLNFNAKKKRS